eukprot:FR741763.1.p2 GENE.FR741763.1~~FR741763.1.p2  ORF type:complete len:145 (-),score=10.97 FR741763.1:356-790(-)
MITAQAVIRPPGTPRNKPQFGKASEPCCFVSELVPLSLVLVGAREVAETGVVSDPVGTEDGLGPARSIEAPETPDTELHTVLLAGAAFATAERNEEAFDSNATKVSLKELTRSSAEEKLLSVSDMTRLNDTDADEFVVDKSRRT